MTARKKLRPKQIKWAYEKGLTLLEEVFDRYACAKCADGSSKAGCPCGFHAAGKFIRNSRVPEKPSIWCKGSGTPGEWGEVVGFDPMYGKCPVCGDIRRMRSTNGGEIIQYHR